MSIHLHIDRLVLDGLPLSPADGPLFKAALVSELTRLMGDGLSPELAEGAAVPRLRAQGIEVAPSDGPGIIGKKIAGSVYGGLGDGRA
jgi:hypothetical protein